MKKKIIYQITVALIFLFFSSSVLGTVPFLDSGQLLRPGKNEISAHVQMVSDPDKVMLNAIVQLDQGLAARRDLNLRYFLGGGKSGFLVGSFAKWVPFPDYRYQPAIGASLGLSYNFFDNKTHYINFHLRPLLSKELGTVVGKFIPYLAFPVSIRIKNLKNIEFPLKIAGGLRGELFFIRFRKVEFNIEVSTDFAKVTPSYFSAGVILYWM